jgi:hypothetical protein
MTLDFQNLSLFRPSVIITPENRYGVAQALLLAIYPKVDFLFFGVSRRYRSVKVADLGACIAKDLSIKKKSSVQIIDWVDFQEILK